MPAPPIRIRIGASVDASVDRAFASVEKRAARAQAMVVRGQEQGARTAAREAEKAATAQERAQDRVARHGRRSADEWARAMRSVGKVAEQELNRQARAQQRANRSAGMRFAERTSHRTTRFLTPNAPLGSMASQAARDIARGVGVDPTFSGALERNRGLESQAIGLAQQERIATGGTSAGPKHFEQVARQAGKELGVVPTQALELARAFTGKTGEFSQIEAVLKRLGPMAIASGTGFEDMGAAAGFFFNQVKHLPNALEVTEQGLRAIIGQTAVGSVEMPDFAREMGRVAANANKFQGNRAENITKLAALAQLSIESGGATSAADAARSVAAFGNTFGKGARIDAFKSAGVDLFTDKSQTQMRDPFEIIKDSFRKTGGNIPQLSNMFADTLGRKPVAALGQAFQAAGGGEAGIKAVDAALKRYMSTTLSADAQQKNMNDHLNSTTVKAQLFQNRLDEIAEKVATKLLPALEKVGPDLLGFAESLGKLTTWVIENPKKTIALAITASIARAGIESAIRSGIERLIVGPGGNRAPSVGNAAGALGGAAVALSIAGAVVSVASITAEQLVAKTMELQEQARNESMGAHELERKAAELQEKGDLPGAAKLLEQAREKRHEAAGAIMSESERGPLENLIHRIEQLIRPEHVQDVEVDQARRLELQQAALEDTRQQLRDLNARIAGGITVNNMPDGGIPGRVPQ